MRTRMNKPALLLSLLALGALGLVACGGDDDDDQAHGDEQTLTYTEAKNGGFSAIGGASAHGTPRGTPPGGGFTISVPLDDDSGSTAGDLNAVCIATREPSAADEPLTGQRTGTADLQNGQLALEVGGKIDDNVTGSIVGGTGDYEGATGRSSRAAAGRTSQGPARIGESKRGGRPTPSPLRSPRASKPPGCRSRRGEFARRGFLRNGASRTRTGDLLGAISRSRAESR
jgi:hypothetical protein